MHDAADGLLRRAVLITEADTAVVRELTHGGRISACVETRVVVAIEQLDP